VPVGTVFNPVGYMVLKFYPGDGRAVGGCTTVGFGFVLWREGAAAAAFPLTKGFSSIVSILNSNIIIIFYPKRIPVIGNIPLSRGNALYSSVFFALQYCIDYVALMGAYSWYSKY
jgi:hypothetical protein